MAENIENTSVNEQVAEATQEETKKVQDFLNKAISAH